MRVAVACLLLIACGDDRRLVQKDAPEPQDSSVDAAPIYPACAQPKMGTQIAFRDIGTLNNVPILATGPHGDSRLFVVEQNGVVRIFKDEVLQTMPFLDLSQMAGGGVIGPTSPGDEKGLLGLAFHPKYATNGQFFIFYTTSRNGNFHDVIARCERSASDPDRADPATCTDLLAFRDPYTNHNGGMMEFGTDGYLYIGTGDGGGGGDPFGYAQDKNEFLGKMLRLDVDNKLPGKEYGIPADNPFASGGGAPEVYMVGLRNPWRWSFDVATGDMWIGDVGQQMVEELNVLRRAQQKGANLGWSIYEGTMCCVTTPYRCESAAPTSNCDPNGFFFPQDSRFPTGGDTGWRSIIAGTVYRGNCFPDLVGWHYYVDWNQRDLIKARLKADDTLEIVDLPIQVPGNPASFHHDGRGEIYLTNTQGKVYRMEVQ